MKSIITSALILLSMFSVAQNNGDRAINARLIGQHSDTYTSGSWAGVDSTRYIFNNPNAGMGEFIYLYDSSYSYSFTSGSWSPYYRYIHSYNSFGSLIQADGHSYDGFAFTPASRNVYTRNANNSILEQTRYGWNGSSWEPATREINTYNANGNQTSSLDQDFVSGAWENYRRFISEYDTNNRLTVYTTSFWGTSDWSNYQRSLYYYNLQGQQDTSVQQTWSGAWVNDYKNVANFGINGLVEFFTGLDWVGSAWELNNRYAYVYSPDSLPITETQYELSGGIFVNKSRKVSEYSASGKMTEQVNQLYNTGTFGWDNQTRTQTAYNSYDLIDSRFGTNWESGAWKPTYRTYYTYEEYEDNATGINNINAVAGVNVYPNPCTQNAMLSFDNAKAGQVSITVIDLSGQQMYSSKQYYDTGSQNILIDAATWASGMYIANINTGNAKANIKLFKN